MKLKTALTIAKTTEKVVAIGASTGGVEALERDAGAFTVAQDEASCVVFGTPKEAIRSGAADRIAALHELPPLITSCSEHVKAINCR